MRLLSGDPSARADQFFSRRSPGFKSKVRAWIRPRSLHDPRLSALGQRTPCPLEGFRENLHIEDPGVLGRRQPARHSGVRSFWLSGPVRKIRTIGFVYGITRFPLYSCRYRALARLRRLAE